MDMLLNRFGTEMVKFEWCLHSSVKAAAYQPEEVDLLILRFDKLPAAKSCE